MRKSASKTKKEKEDPKKLPQPDLPEGTNFSIGWIYVILFGIILTVSVFRDTSLAKETTWQEFNRNMLQRRAVARIEVINNERVDVYIDKKFSQDPAFKDVFAPAIGSQPDPGPHYAFTIGSVETFEDKLDKAQANFKEEDKVDVRYVKQSNWLMQMFGWIFLFVIITIIWQYMFRRMAAGGRSLLGARTGASRLPEGSRGFRHRADRARLRGRGRTLQGDHRCHDRRSLPGRRQILV